mgnify:CR=1 FL=1
MREKIVVGNVIHMAGELGMQVICEGVETQAQSITLQEIGCKYSQGFYFTVLCSWKTMKNYLLQITKNTAK